MSELIPPYRIVAVSRVSLTPVSADNTLSLCLDSMTTVYPVYHGRRVKKSPAFFVMRAGKLIRAFDIREHFNSSHDFDNRGLSNSSACMLHSVHNNMIPFYITRSGYPFKGGLVEKIPYKSSVPAKLRQVVLECFPPNNDGVNIIFNFHSREVSK